MNQNLYMSTLLKAFDILDCFQNDRQELGISDIAAMVDMPVSSVHRIIQSLEFVGMLTQNRENRKYALGSRLLNLSEKCGQYQQFQQIASRYVDQLGKLTGETVNLIQRGSALRGRPGILHPRQATVRHLDLRAAVADGRCVLRAGAPARHRLRRTHLTGDPVGRIQTVILHKQEEHLP